MNAKLLGDRVHMERRTLRINQDELARRSGVSRTYISEIENYAVTNPTVEVIINLAAALGVSPAYLLGWTDAPLSGEAAVIGEERIPYTVDPRIQELIDLYEDLDAPTQQIALDIIRTIRRSQHARVVGA